MPILEYKRKEARRTIGFFEEDPPNKAVASLTGFEIRKFNRTDLLDPTQLANVAAVIFRQRKSQPNKIARDIKQYAKTLLGHDCRVFLELTPVEPGSESLISYRRFVLKAIEEEQLPASGLQPNEAKSHHWSVDNLPMLTPMVHILDDPSTWIRVAAYLRDFPPGSPPSLALNIEAVDENNEVVEISCAQKVLIQRAFHDCSTVKLVRNSDGRSGVDTYRVFATPKIAYISHSPPYEFFAKIGGRVKISKEYLAYRDNALEHIPFHLGPRLRLDRCALGAQEGIIVSDYVNGAEKLRDCARDGRAVPVIASLFNTTLRAWQDGSRTVERPLQAYLKDRMPDEIPEHRRSLIERYGMLKKPTELQALLDTMGSKPVRVGVVHGDLHALNVLVRNGDAIVIDFEKVADDVPLLLDLASLEAGLFVDGFVGARRTARDLLKSIKSLYEIDALVQHKFNPCDPSDGSAWYFDCVRQVRLQARQIELSSSQYAFALAIELAKKACNRRNFDCVTERSGQVLTAERVRALAYVLAERILLKLSRTNAGN